MPSGRRRFRRSLGERRYRKLYVIATEGDKTEPQYFAIFRDPESVIRLKCLKAGRSSAPAHVLKRMEEHLKKERLRSTDEAWLVVDKDPWTVEQLEQLHRRAEQRPNYGFALINPKFESWLLLHCEDGGAHDLLPRLRRHLPEYDKGIRSSQFTEQRIREAVERAKRRDHHSGADWPRSDGTTVYRLVEHPLGSARLTGKRRASPWL